MASPRSAACSFPITVAGFDQFRRLAETFGDLTVTLLIRGLRAGRAVAEAPRRA